MKKLAIIAVVLLATGCGSAVSTPVEPVPTSSAAPDLPNIDLRKEPGNPCATSRLGKSFTKGGVTYVCKGPKPYKWRKESTATKKTPAKRRVVSKPVPTKRKVVKDSGSSGGFVCKDGTRSHALHRRGACSHHGGVK